jgi:hypothetical protein
VISLLFSLIVIIVLTVWGIRTKYPLAFQLCFGVAIVTAWRWYDVFDTVESLAISVIILIYAFIMAGAALTAMFRENGNEEDGK